MSAKSGSNHERHARQVKNMLKKCSRCGETIEWTLLDEAHSTIHMLDWYQGQPGDIPEIHHKGKRYSLCPNCTWDLRGFMLKVIK